jgi:hypothetical protein
MVAKNRAHRRRSAPAVYYDITVLSKRSKPGQTGFSLLAVRQRPQIQYPGGLLSHRLCGLATEGRRTAGLMTLAWISLARQPVLCWPKAESPRRIWGTLLVAVFFDTCRAIWLQQVSLKFASAGIAQMRFSASPLFVLPLAGRSGNRVSVREVLAAFVVLIGVGLLYSLR